MVLIELLIFANLLVETRLASLAQVTIWAKKLKYLDMEFTGISYGQSDMHGKDDMEYFISDMEVTFFLHYLAIYICQGSR